MRIFVPALLAITVLFLSSCQQEPDVILGDPPATADSTRITMYVELDTTLPTGQDTLYKIVYKYDSQQRLTTEDYTDLYWFPDIETGTTEYFYNGSDRQANKVVDVFYDAIAMYRDTFFLSYTDGYISRDSVIEYKVATNEFWGTSVNYFTRNGSNVIVKKRQYNLPGISPLSGEKTGTLFQTLLNGNIVSQEDTISSVFDQVNFNRPHHTVSYDNKKNPFWELDLRYPVLGRAVTNQKNNVVEERTWDTGGSGGSGESHELYSYTYRPDGFPATAIVNEPGNNFLYKVVFLYNH